ncbi:hypothetical protein, partial [Segatella oulorum]|uniref:hypothetical protein n=1 Tax=Segatella oulorum TaxID=28136 RepID=UPI0023F262BA
HMSNTTKILHFYLERACMRLQTVFKAVIHLFAEHLQQLASPIFCQPFNNTVQTAVPFSTYEFIIRLV